MDGSETGRCETPASFFRHMDASLENSVEQDLLFNAVNTGDVHKVQKLFESNLRLCANCRDKEGVTILATACFKGQYEIAKILIEKGADVNTKSKNSYTPLMFAAISGNTDICKLLMDEGAYAYATNDVGKTAGEVAGFTGQHECASVINNHISRDDVTKLLHPHGEDSEETYCNEFIVLVHGLASSHLIHPVAIVFTLRNKHEYLLHRAKIIWVLDRLFEKQLRCKEPNEVMSMKMWLVLHTVRELAKFIDSQKEKEYGYDQLCTAYIRYLLRVEQKDRVRPRTEYQIRQAIYSFPYTHSLIHQTLLKALNGTVFGERPTAFEFLTQVVFGQRLLATSKFCDACGHPNAKLRCPACKLPYCSTFCQKFDWTFHKKMCEVYIKRHREDEKAKGTILADPDDAQYEVFGDTREQIPGWVAEEEENEAEGKQHTQQMEAEMERIKLTTTN